MSDEQTITLTRSQVEELHAIIHDKSLPLGNRLQGLSARLYFALKEAGWTALATPPAAIPAPGDFPARIMALLHTVADRNPPEDFGVFEDDEGNPMQDDADAAIAWVQARAHVAAIPAAPSEAVTPIPEEEILQAWHDLPNHIDERKNFIGAVRWTETRLAQPAPVQPSKERA